MSDVSEGNFTGIMKVDLPTMTRSEVNGILPNLDPCGSMEPGPHMSIPTLLVVNMPEFSALAVVILKVVPQIVCPEMNSSVPYANGNLFLFFFVLGSAITVSLRHFKLFEMSFLDFWVLGLETNVTKCVRVLVFPVYSYPFGQCRSEHTLALVRGTGGS